MIFNPIIKKTVVEKVDSETVVAELDMASGDQTIKPPQDGTLIDKVIVKKPESLKAENIRDGISIGGVVGAYKLAESVMPIGEPITSEEEFLAMESSNDYYLANDIVISKSYGTFRGILYGNGKTITTSVPVFERLENASVYNFTIKGEISLPTITYVGALACRATAVHAYQIINKADVTAKSYVGGIVGYATDVCTFWGCINAGAVYSNGGNAAGILAFGLTDATFTHCSNVGAITLNDKSSSSDNGEYIAAGIVGWLGGTGYAYYCVNTGSISGNRGCGGIGGRFGETANVNGHIIFGCVNVGHISTSLGRVGGLVRRTYGRSEFTYNTISGSLKTADGVVSAIVDYNTSNDTDYSNNVVLLGRNEVVGDEKYAAVANGGTKLTSANDFYRLYVFNDDTFKYLFKSKGESSVPMPNSYSYYFTAGDLVDGTLADKLGNTFVMEDGIPMHKGVVGTYRLACEVRDLDRVQTEPAVLTVTFRSYDYNEEITPHSGYYTVSDLVNGIVETVYFENAETLSVQSFIESEIVIRCYEYERPSSSDFGFEVFDVEGCDASVDDHDDLVTVTITDSVAAVTIISTEA